MIRGIDVTLYRKQQTGEDAFGAPVFNEVSETVHNVLVGEPTAEDLVNELQLYGKRLAYTLALPERRRARLARRDGRVFRAAVSHVRRRDGRYRSNDPFAMEQKGEGGAVWLR